MTTVTIAKTTIFHEIAKELAEKKVAEELAEQEAKHEEPLRRLGAFSTLFMQIKGYVEACAEARCMPEELSIAFDYLASRLDEAKLITNFGGSEWIYHERDTSEILAKRIKRFKELEESED